MQFKSKQEVHVIRCVYGYKGLHDIKLADIDVCFVENVGNLLSSIL